MKSYTEGVDVYEKNINQLLIPDALGAYGLDSRSVCLRGIGCCF